MERRLLASDLLAVSTLDHACVIVQKAVGLKCLWCDLTLMQLLVPCDISANQKLVTFRNDVIASSVTSSNSYKYVTLGPKVTHFEHIFQSRTNVTSI